MMKYKRGLYGFEDYNTIALSNDIIIDNTVSSYDFYGYYSDRVFLVPDSYEGLDFDEYSRVSIKEPLIQNNKELLNTAKKVYVHPSCKLSRSLVATKYKKCLNPWLADAVVIPNIDSYAIAYKECMLFSDEISKTIVIVLNTSDWLSDYFKIIPIDSSIREVSKAKNISEFEQHTTNGIKISDILNAKLFYRGKVILTPVGNTIAIDIITKVLPTSKMVFEESMQEALGSEENKVTFDSMMSIHDMLYSPDENTKGAALKALSMMDYMKYSNSVKYELEMAGGIRRMRRIPASKSTSVKFMLNQLNEDYSTSIYPEDFDLFKQLVKHYMKTNTDGEILRWMSGYSFIAVNDSGQLTPVLRESA